MHDETIPAPLRHRDLPRRPEPESNANLVLKLAAAALLAACVIVPLLR